jgi:hypothetical protein
VACMGEKREVCKVLVGRDHLEDRGVDERSGSNWISGSWGGGGVNSIVSGQGREASSCECGGEPSCSDATELLVRQIEQIHKLSFGILL